VKPEERRELLNGAAHIRSRARRLEGVAAALHAQADELTAEVHGDGKVVVGGGDLIDALNGLVDVGERVHYTELEDRLLIANIVPGGANPSNTLIAALGRSAEYQKAPARSGFYRRKRHA
jgi:hypothetical protein